MHTRPSASANPPNANAATMEGWRDRPSYFFPIGLGNSEKDPEKLSQ